MPSLQKKAPRTRLKPTAAQEKGEKSEGLWEADRSGMEKAKHARASTLRPIPESAALDAVSLSECSWTEPASKQAGQEPASVFSFFRRLTAEALFDSPTAQS